jgi:hypothetical protein
MKYFIKTKYFDIPQTGRMIHLDGIVPIAFKNPLFYVPECHRAFLRLKEEFFAIMERLITPPRWGAETASHLPDSIHLITPGAHCVGGKCIRDIPRQFLDSGLVNELDISCIKDMRLPPFKIE